MSYWECSDWKYPEKFRKLPLNAIHITPRACRNGGASLFDWYFPCKSGTTKSNFPCDPGEWKITYQNCKYCPCNCPPNFPSGGCIRESGTKDDEFDTGCPITCAGIFAPGCGSGVNGGLSPIIDRQYYKRGRISLPKKDFYPCVFHKANEFGNPVAYREPTDSPHVYTTCDPRLDNEFDNIYFQNMLPFCFGSDKDVIEPSRSFDKVSQAGTNDLNQPLNYSVITIPNNDNLPHIEMSKCETLRDRCLTGNFGCETEAKSAMRDYCSANGGANFRRQFCQDYFENNVDELKIVKTEFLQYLNSLNETEFADKTGWGYKMLAKLIEGGDIEIDNFLTNWCYNHGINPTSIGSASDEIKNLCSCHMPQEFYDNFIIELRSRYPQLESVPLNGRCLLFQDISGALCNVSDFPDTTTAQQGDCPIITCIQIAEVDSTGSNIGKIEIDQSAECQAIIGGNVSSSASVSSSINVSSSVGSVSSESPGININTIILISVGAAIGLIVLIIIIILIVYFIRRSQRNQQYTYAYY